MKRTGMLVSERVDRIGKKKERGNEESVSLLSQMSRLPLYSYVLFIRLLVFLSSKAICPSIPSIPFSPAPSLLHCILPGGYFG